MYVLVLKTRGIGYDVYSDVVLCFMDSGTKETGGMYDSTQGVLLDQRDWRMEAV